MRCSCGTDSKRKRRTGPAAGLFVCKCGRAIGPRPLLEAKQWGVPLWVRNLIHRQMCDEGPATTPAIAARQRATRLGMIVVFHALAAGLRTMVPAEPAKTDTGEEAVCES